MIFDIFVVAALVLAVLWAMKHKARVKSWFGKVEADVKGSSTPATTSSNPTSATSATTPPSNAPPAA